MFALPFFAFATVLFVRMLSVLAHEVIWEVAAYETAHSVYLPHQDWYVNPTPERVVGNGPVEDPALIDQCIDDTKSRINGREPAVMFATIPADSTLDSNWTRWFKARVTAKGGRIDDGKQAAIDLLYKHKNKASATIPETLRPGEYVVHYETIALHHGAQVYEDDFPMGNLLVSAPGSRRPNPPGIVSSMYTNTVSSDYPTPGPRAWTS